MVYFHCHGTITADVNPWLLFRVFMQGLATGVTIQHVLAPNAMYAIHNTVRSLETPASCCSETKQEFLETGFD